jgi:hypothetical protein
MPSSTKGRKASTTARKAASTTARKAPQKAAAKVAAAPKAPKAETREQKAAAAANASLLGGPRPIAEGQALSTNEVDLVATQLGRSAGSKAAIVKAAGLTLPQLKAFAGGQLEGRGMAGLDDKARSSFDGFYRKVKAANPSPRVRPRKVAAALLGLHTTAAK